MSISAKRLKEIEAIQDKDIDYSEIPEADEGFWKRVELPDATAEERYLYPLGYRCHRLAEIEGQGLPDPDERHAARVDAKRARAEGSLRAALMVVTGLVFSPFVVHSLSSICTFPALQRPAWCWGGL